MYGLVLEGGGAKGSYHIGAYKAILEEGIEIKGIAGTSIGALNGAMIVQGDFEICYKLWEELSYSMIIGEKDKEIEKLLQFEPSVENFKLAAQKTFEIITGKGISTEPFRKLLKTYIDEERIRQSNMDFGIVTVNLSDLKPEEIMLEDIPEGKLIDYLMASAYLPVFKIERLGGKIYLDGGFYDNLPFRILLNKGYKDLILVRTHGRGLTRKIDTNKINATIISPSDDIGRSYTYEANIAKRNIRLGYFDGLKALRGLLGNKYYIDDKNCKDFALDFLLSIEDEKIDKIVDLMKGPEVKGKRALFEYIIPKLGSIMGLKDDFSYQEFLVELLEKRALKSQVERFKIYSIKEFFHILKNKVKESEYKKMEERSSLEKVIEKVDIALLFNKEDLLLEITDILLKED